MSIYKKLLEIQKEVDHFVKDEKGHNYEYTTGNQVLNKIRPLMNDKGLLLKQEVLDFTNELITYKTKYGEKTEVLTATKQKFTWIDSESGEKDEILFGGNGFNDFDKGFGSALTYSERYFLLKYFHVPTDELDPDKRQEEKKTIKKELPVIWINDKQVEKAISMGEETIKQTLSFYDGKTERTDTEKGIVYKACISKVNKTKLENALSK